MCILVVEDEFLIRLIVAEELAENGFAVCEAENGDRASALIAAQPDAFTLLVTDVHMPGKLDGIEVARLLRAPSGHPRHLHDRAPRRDRCPGTSRGAGSPDAEAVRTVRAPGRGAAAARGGSLSNGVT